MNLKINFTYTRTQRSQKKKKKPSDFTVSGRGEQNTSDLQYPKNGLVRNTGRRVSISLIILLLTSVSLKAFYLFAFCQRFHCMHFGKTNLWKWTLSSQSQVHECIEIFAKWKHHSKNTNIISQKTGGININENLARLNSRNW